MFKEGDLVVYGNAGVCRVIKIGPLPMGGGGGKDYYTLEPFFSPNSRVFTPCDNDKIVIRPILSRQEAEKILDEFPQIGLLEVPEEKKREDIYKAAMHSCEMRELISILKTITLRKQARLAQGKKATASDEKYYAMAYEKLCDELAVVLGADREKIRAYICEKIEKMEA